MNIRKLTEHLNIHPDKVIAFVVSDQIRSLELSHLPDTVKTLVFECNSMNPEVLKAIPLSVINVCFSSNETNLQHRFHQIPPHLEVFQFGMRVREGVYRLPVVKQFLVKQFLLFNTNKRKHRDGEYSRGTG